MAKFCACQQLLLLLCWISPWWVSSLTIRRNRSITLIGKRQRLPMPMPIQRIPLITLQSTTKNEATPTNAISTTGLPPSDGSNHENVGPAESDAARLQSTSSDALDVVPNRHYDETSMFVDYCRPPDRDAMIARAAVLRQSILKQQIELQNLERDILCIGPSSDKGNAFLNHPLESLARTAYQSRDTFLESTSVLKRKLQRVQGKVGRNNQKYEGSVEQYVATQTVSGARILTDLALHPDRLAHLVDPNTAALVPHLPAIYARLDKLEPHVTPILEKVLNNKQHLGSIEPYLEQVLERFDDIEPHFPWILKNIDTLAPYTGLLLKHIDELLLYAECEDDLNSRDRYALAEQLLPYLEFYVSRLDLVGPHLPLLRPHIPKLLKNNRVAKITPHVDRLFARGYLNVGTSANLDILLFWVGWTLRVPLLPRIFFAIPGSPRFVSFLANRMPRRFARKCANVRCSLDGDYGSNWNRLSKD